MKAIVCTKYGPPEALVLKDVARPVPKDDEVLIRIHATSVTASDALIRAMDQNLAMRCLLQAIFGFGRPRRPILGMTLSGEVAEVGRKVTAFRPGDKVFAYGSKSATVRRFGSYAEYLCLPEDWHLLPKPANLTHVAAAALPYGGFLAWHCVRTRGDVRRGQRVLVYGASGSIGTMAVQLAKHAGAAHVTAVCSGKNADLVTSLGADEVLDYTRDDAVAALEQEGRAYDVVIDAVGNTKTSPLKVAARKAVTKGGQYVGIDDDVPATPREVFVRLRELAEGGHLAPVIDRSFPLEEMARAHAYVDAGHKAGNVAIAVTDRAEER